MSKLKLNEKVIFCKNCVESNLRYLGSIPFADTVESKKQVTFFEEGVCGACKYFETKHKIDWQEREKELIEILNIHRKSNGDYDVLIPGSGGKDSIYLSHILKHKYKMHPLTVTWAPHIYTDIGGIILKLGRRWVLIMSCTLLIQKFTKN